MALAMRKVFIACVVFAFSVMQCPLEFVSSNGCRSGFRRRENGIVPIMSTDGYITMRSSAGEGEAAIVEKAMEKVPAISQASPLVIITVLMALGSFVQNIDKPDFRMPYKDWRKNGPVALWQWNNLRWGPQNPWGPRR